MIPVIVVHGGAGHISEERVELSRQGVREAVLHGYRILQRGGTALDAVEEAVVQMENNPVFNAGRGSVLNELGDIEMDAIIMDGKTLNSGAVSAVRRIANPIKLSRLVMEKTNHVCLTGHGASRFAKAMGIPEVPEEFLKTDYSRMRWKKNLPPGSNPVQCQMGKMGTVGAVAIDAEGNVASATSTGGRLNKMVGRVGDTACVGCGAYADNYVGAASPTGCGEEIMKVTLCRLILFHMEQGKSPKEASDIALAYMFERVQGFGGVVVLDKTGDWAARFNSKQMSWAAAKDDQLYNGLYKDELLSMPISKT
ncbi:isoaspartyl peptidase/L-asparaginase [Lepisosteus oculatus]|uniref:Isoaspartyl peptidase/L-asparaginase n=1 Tax=Lepisosteus oculatus TaxID=7918 RepID=W5NH49_LEPOC|nr:PREDICTED: isoaspartyl peptidase/L-asparaginase [Lepisosteus oculatus]XP_015218728.1 PREDICTED: isoaspartyl peptidase/L-asparaginase [Lepisosteus oculatus]